MKGPFAIVWASRMRARMPPRFLYNGMANFQNTEKKTKTRQYLKGDMFFFGESKQNVIPIKQQLATPVGAS